MSKKNRLMQFLGTPTAKLAATYLGIIMLMSISFSAVFYSTSARQLARPLPPSGQAIPSMGINGRPFDDQVRSIIEERFAQARQALLFRLIWINLGALALGSAVSYALARKSLQPIEEAMEAQTQFVSDASHELRTPLTVLQTTNEVALRKKKLNLSEARDTIAHNVEEVVKLRNLSDSLLDLLKNTDTDITMTSVNLTDAVGDSLQHIVTIAQQKNITINETIPPLTVSSNKVLLSRIITILLDNAVKYSEDGKTITITAEQVDGKVRLSVIDEGIGMKASDLPHIFRRFYRADKSRSANDVRGYGLGLSIADKIAHELGAKITVKSAPGKGSTFTIKLPAYSPEQQRKS